MFNNNINKYFNMDVNIDNTKNNKYFNMDKITGEKIIAHNISWLCSLLTIT